MKDVPEFPQKLKDLRTRLWYARQAIAQGWSRDTLSLMIKSHTHNRQGASVTNFDTQLPDNLKSVLPTIEEIEAELSAGLQEKKKRRTDD